jgi:hypothetical protein
MLEDVTPLIYPYGEGRVPENGAMMTDFQNPLVNSGLAASEICKRYSPTGWSDDKPIIPRPVQKFSHD